MTSVLSESALDSFWSEVSPDIRNFMRDFEEREMWTHKVHESPLLYEGLGYIISLTESASDYTGDFGDDVIDPLLVALSSVPFGYFMLAMSRLERRHDTVSSSIGERVVDRATYIYYNDKNNMFYAEAKVVYDRVALFVDSSLMVGIFSNIR